MWCDPGMFGGKVEPWRSLVPHLRRALGRRRFEFGQLRKRWNTCSRTFDAVADVVTDYTINGQSLSPSILLLRRVEVAETLALHPQTGAQGLGEFAEPLPLRAPIRVPP